VAVLLENGEVQSELRVM